MPKLLPELAAFAPILDGQPKLVWDAFKCCLCLLMVEALKIRLVDKVPGENGTVCVFETMVGDRFSEARPTISEEQEAALRYVLREILKEEGVS